VIVGERGLQSPGATSKIAHEGAAQSSRSANHRRPPMLAAQGPHEGPCGRPRSLQPARAQLAERKRSRRRHSTRAPVIPNVAYTDPEGSPWVGVNRS